jgi:cell division protein FtsL
MKKNKKLYRNLILFVISVYFIFTIFSQQTTLSQYTQDAKELSQKIESEKEKKEELAKKKDDVNSLDFIEQTAREKLDMYYPNERIYVDKGM